MQTQEAELKAAQEMLAQATAKALQLEKHLQEACRQLAVLSEDDQDLQDKVSLSSTRQVPENSIWSPVLAVLAQGISVYEQALLHTGCMQASHGPVTPWYRNCQEWHVRRGA